MNIEASPVNIRMFDNRRLKNLNVDCRDVAAILSGKAYIENLPYDAMLVGAHAPYQIRGWVLTFFHESFPEIDSGLEIPSLLAFIRYHDDGIKP